MRYILVLLKIMFISTFVSLIVLANSNVYSAYPYQKEIVPINEGEGYIEGTFNDYTHNIENEFRVDLKNVIFYPPPEMPESMRKHQEKMRKSSIEQMKKSGMLSDAMLKQMEATVKQAKNAKPVMTFQLKGDASIRASLNQTSTELSIVSFSNPYTINTTISGTLSGKQPGKEKASKDLTKAVSNQMTAMTGSQYQTIDKIQNKNDYNVVVFISFDDPVRGNDIVVTVKRRMSGKVYVGGQSNAPSGKPADGKKVYGNEQKARMSLNEVIKGTMCHGILDNTNKTLKIVADSELNVGGNLAYVGSHWRIKCEGVIKLQKPFKGFEAPAKKKARADKKQTVDKVKEKKKVPEEEKEKAEKQKEKKEEKTEVKKDSAEDKLPGKSEDEIEEIWKIPPYSNVVTDEYWDGLSIEHQQQLHYARNKYQRAHPERVDGLDGNWKNYGEAIAHNLAGDKGNTDWRGTGPNKKQQAVYSSDGDLVTSPENMGTYDFINPISFLSGHAQLDVAPWIEWGNSPDDTTTRGQRISALRSTYGGNILFLLMKTKGWIKGE